MTVNDLLKRIPKEDYDKVIILGDYQEGWCNLSGKVNIDQSTIIHYIDLSRPYNTI